MNSKKTTDDEATLSAFFVLFFFFAAFTDIEILGTCRLCDMQTLRYFFLSLYSVCYTRY